jgi:hypothetical protein
VLKGLRHPNLLSTVGAWQVGPHLIIAMELADGTLADRLRAARDSGLPGIPGPELPEYLREAAKGIDFLNEPRHVLGGRTGVRFQHRDIKPANILLVGTGVKVADFGLVRLLERTYASHTGALTPAYAAPEFFNGKTSPHSDQYSLAITYCQLRTGRLPFEGSLAELMYGHVHARPALSLLPEAERAPVARALAKRPEDRWPDCRTFIEAVAAAQLDRPARMAARPGSGRRRAGVMLGLLAVGLVALVQVTRPRRAPSPQPGPPGFTSMMELRAGAASRVRDDPPSGSMRTTEPRVSGAQAAAATEPEIPDAMKRPARPETTMTEPLLRYAGHEGGVRCVAWHPDGESIVSGGDDGALRLWGPRTGETERILTGHRKPVAGLAISPDGNHLLTGSRDGTVRYWSVRSGEELWQQQAHQSPVHCVAISPDGTRGLSGSQDGPLRVWDLRSGRQAAPIESRVEYLSAAFTPDGRHLLAAGDSPIVSRFQVETGKEVGTFGGHRDVVWSVACASRGEWAASGGGDVETSQDYRVCVWHATRGELRREFAGHAGAVVAVAIAPDGRRVLSGSADRTVRLWDCDTGRQLCCFRGHDGIVTSVAFAPDGAHAVSGGLDGIASIWELPTPRH